MRNENVLVTCERCGDLEISSREMTLVITESEKLAYCFACTRCGEIIVRSCDVKLARCLREVGVLPYEVDLVAVARDRPLFTMNDVEKFTRLLRADDFVVGLVLRSRPSL